MFAMQRRLRIAAAVVVVLGAASAAQADDVADACMDYAASSEQLKPVPAASKSKWCGCIAGKIAPGDRAATARVIAAQKASEAKGQAFSPDTLPPAQKKAGDAYFEALGACLPVLLGSGPPPSAAPSQAESKAPPRSRPQASAPPAEARAAPVGRTTGAAAWRMVVGNTLAATANGKEFADYYGADGTIRSRHDGDEAVGEWSFADGKVCFVFPKEDEDCYEVAVSGDTVVLTDDTGASMRLTLLRGNPKRL